MVAEDGLPAVIVNPSTPVGPRDVKPTPTGRIIVEAASGRMPAYVDTGLNLVHVDDVAAGHLLAFEHGRIGERYILGGDNLPLAEMLGEIARSGWPHPSPRPLAHGTPVPPGRRGRRHRAADRQGTFPHPRRSAHGGQADVLLIGQGRAGVELPAPPGCGRAGGRPYMVPGSRICPEKS